MTNVVTSSTAFEFPNAASLRHDFEYEISNGQETQDRGEYVQRMVWIRYLCVSIWWN